MNDCASCGAAIERAEGPGRPSSYCSPGCRRLAEFRIRALLRRVDRHELELRELDARDLGDYRYDDQAERQRRRRLFRKWLAEDQKALRALLGAKP